MRPVLCAGLLAAAACEVIRLVPSCDPTCMKGRFLASYHPVPAMSAVHIPGVASAPVPQSPAAALPPRASSARPVDVPQPRTVVTTVVKLVQQPAAMVQPVRAVQMPGPVAGRPGQAVGVPGRGQHDSMPVGGDVLGRIGRRVNMIYTMLVGMKQRDVRAVPQRPRIVLVAPVATTTVVKTISLRPGQRARASPKAASRAAPVATVTKYVAQPQQARPGTRPQAPCTVAVPKTGRGGEAKPSGTQRKAPADRDSDEDSSSQSSDAGQKGKMEVEKPPYMGMRAGGPVGVPEDGRSPIECYLAENPSRCMSGRRPDIGRAVVYRDDLDSSDEVVYLSDLLWGR